MTTKNITEWNFREEFLDCFAWSPKGECWYLLPRRTPERIWDLVIGNYAGTIRLQSKRELLEKIKTEVIGDGVTGYCVDDSGSELAKVIINVFLGEQNKRIDQLINSLKEK